MFFGPIDIYEEMVPKIQNFSKIPDNPKIQNCSENQKIYINVQKIQKIQNCS